MNINHYLLFVTVTSIFLLSPGPSVLLSINNGVRYGAKRTAIAVLGNVIAFQLLIALSALGLGALLTASSEVFTVLKILGALYLIYLGTKMWRAPATVKNEIAPPATDSSSSSHLFRRAFLVTSSNPKALVYVSALLPQFLDTQQALLPQVLLLGLTTAVIQFLIFMSYAVIGSKSKKWFEDAAKLRVFNKISGAIFIGFGVALGLSREKT